MYHLFFVWIWLKNSIFGEFSNIYLLSAQNRVKWRHKIRPIAKNFRLILIYFAPDDAKLIPGEVCQVSCRYSNKWRSYFRKTEGGGRIRPAPRRWRVIQVHQHHDMYVKSAADKTLRGPIALLRGSSRAWRGPMATPKVYKLTHMMITQTISHTTPHNITHDTYVHIGMYIHCTMCISMYCT